MDAQLGPRPKAILETRCPRCRRVYYHPPSMAGRQVACPCCSLKLTLEPPCASK